MFPRRYTVLMLGLGTLIVGNCHMALKQPVPFGKSTLDTAPLKSDGSDFPCKQRPGVYDLQGASNVCSPGAMIPLTFAGTASHGGGSCQISLTTDLKPDGHSVWKVIYSIQGGCPARGSEGNTGSDSYSFRIPLSVKPGQYSLAWTWFNRIGNREMYMNCAPLTVTENGTQAVPADSGPQKGEGLPDMYVANICGSSCETLPNLNVIFPSPGTNMDSFIMASQSGSPATCSCANGGQPKSAALETSSMAGQTKPVEPTSSFAKVLDVVTAAAKSRTIGPTSSMMSNTTLQPCSSSLVVCSPDGERFGLCDWGVALMQQVAKGTRCVGGAVVRA